MSSDAATESYEASRQPHAFPGCLSFVYHSCLIGCLSPDYYPYRSFLDLKSPDFEPLLLNLSRFPGAWMQEWCLLYQCLEPLCRLPKSLEQDLRAVPELSRAPPTLSASPTG